VSVLSIYEYWVLTWWPPHPQILSVSYALRTLLLQLCAPCYSGSSSASTLARTKSFQTEALLISMGYTYAEQKVTDPCPTKLVTGIIFSSAAGSSTSYALCHSSTGTSETTHHWSQMDMQQSPSQALSCPHKRPPLDQPLMLLRHFFFFGGEDIHFHQESSFSFTLLGF
jgi:hypothetical protein